MSSWARRSCLVLSLTTLLAATAIPAVAAESLPDQLVKQVGSAGINRHLIALQRIADTNNHSRAMATDGHKASAEYVAGKLEAAGYEVTRQEFPFIYTQTLAQKLTVNGTDVPIFAMTYTPSTPVGGITAPLAVIPVDATPGCEKSDFGDVTGKIVLVQRGACSFVRKQRLAADAGAVATVIYNNVDGDLNTSLTDRSAARIPTGGITKAAGADLATHAGAQVTLELRQLQESRTSYNVVAETKTGRKDNVVMTGAHLDSVQADPGINDNGSGSATLLEIALRLGGSPKVANAVRFGFWGAELDWIGSTYYVDSLSFDQRLDIALYLNFDMIASSNAGYFVYDGDDSDHTGAGPGPYGSAQIEQTFTEYLNGHGVATEGTDIGERSDYRTFSTIGIPAGGLSTGAEGIKTAEQATKWGGKAGTAYDPCYHQLCDNLGNLDYVALDRNAAAAAYAIGTFALSTQPVNGVTATGAATKPARVHAQARQASQAS